MNGSRREIRTLGPRKPQPTPFQGAALNHSAILLISLQPQALSLVLSGPTFNEEISALINPFPNAPLGGEGVLNVGTGGRDLHP